MKTIESVGARQNEWVLGHLDFEQEISKKSEEISHAVEFDALVQKLKYAVSFDQDSIAMAGELVGDFELNVEDWFMFVKLNSDEKIKGIAKGSNGQIYRMVLGETPLAKSIDEEVSSESLLLGIAITAAKLEKVRDLMGNTHLQHIADSYISELYSKRDLILFPEGWMDRKASSPRFGDLKMSEAGKIRLDLFLGLGGVTLAFLVLLGGDNPVVDVSSVIAEYGRSIKEDNAQALIEYPYDISSDYSNSGYSACQLPSDCLAGVESCLPGDVPNPLGEGTQMLGYCVPDSDNK